MDGHSKPVPLRELIAAPELRLLLPDLQVTGRPIAVEFRPALTVVRGTLRSGEARGRDVHAAAFLRERRIVLDSELQHGERVEMCRILLHELFHFAWWKLGNPRRRSYRELIEQERRRRARGEMGWSAEVTREGPEAAYLCESFCDTAAWYVCGDHTEVTLARTFRERRRRWFAHHILSSPVSL